MKTIDERLKELEEIIAELNPSDQRTLMSFFANQLEEVYAEILELHEHKHNLEIIDARD